MSQFVAFMRYFAKTIVIFRSSEILGLDEGESGAMVQGIRFGTAVAMCLGRAETFRRTGGPRSQGRRSEIEAEARLNRLGI